MKNELTAQRLSHALHINNMKAQELADLSHVNKASISQYINGTHSPSNISAGKMAEVLGVSPVWLMGFDVPMTDAALPSSGFINLTAEERQLVEHFRAADEPIRVSVRKLLDMPEEKSKSSDLVG